MAFRAGEEEDGGRADLGSALPSTDDEQRPKAPERPTARWARTPARPNGGPGWEAAPREGWPFEGASGEGPVWALFLAPPGQPG